MRRKIVAANWKMNGSFDLVKAFAQAKLNKADVEIIYGLPAIFLNDAHKNGLSSLAAEDVSAHKNGAFTGEISAEMLKEVGCEYCIIGHSERRQYHFEKEDLLIEKIKQLQVLGITPIYCIGESEAEYDDGLTLEAIKRQIQPLIDAKVIDEKIILAYEPVWAIGTGKAATPEYAQKVSALIRQQLSENCATIAPKIHILYGGSVKGNKASSLIVQPDIDGFLVGGASLDVKSFSEIIEAI